MTIALKYWKEITIGILLIALAIAGRSCSSRQDDIDLLKEAKDSSFHVAVAHQLKSGQLAFQVKTQQVTISQLKGNAMILGYDKKKKLEDQVGNLNNLVAYWQGQASAAGSSDSKARDTVIIEVNKGDTMKLKEKAFSWSNHFLTLHEQYNPLMDSLHRQYTYTTAFTLTAYRKKNGFFKPKQLVTDVTFSDPNMTVGKFQGIVIKEPRKPINETTVFWILAGVGLGWLIFK